MSTHIHQTFLSFIDFFSIFVTWKGCVRNWGMLRTLPIPIYGLSALCPNILFYPFLSTAGSEENTLEIEGDERARSPPILSPRSPALSLFSNVFCICILYFCSVSHTMYFCTCSHTHRTVSTIPSIAFPQIHATLFPANTCTYDSIIFTNLV